MFYSDLQNLVSFLFSKTQDITQPSMLEKLRKIGQEVLEIGGDTISMSPQADYLK